VIVQPIHQPVPEIVAPQVVQPIVNVTIESPAQPERVQDELRREPSGTHPRDQGERKTDGGQPAKQPEMRQPVAPDAEKVHLPLPTGRKQKAPETHAERPSPEVKKKPSGPIAGNGKVEETFSAPETKTSAPEEKGSAAKRKPEVDKVTGKLKVFGTKGRIHTEQDIDAILDVYLISQYKQGRGVLPLYVSERMQRNYKVHRRLPERRKVLERDGKLPASAAGSV
jgi:hypothetical protein